MTKVSIHAGHFIAKDGTVLSVAVTIYTHKLGELIERARANVGGRTSSWSGGAVELSVIELLDGVAITKEMAAAEPPARRPVRRARRSQEPLPRMVEGPAPGEESSDGE